MQVRPAAAVKILGGGVTTLRPFGQHVMLHCMPLLPLHLPLLLPLHLPLLLLLHLPLLLPLLQLSPHCTTGSPRRRGTRLLGRGCACPAAGW